MGRPDPAISFLKDIGFIPVRLPQEGLAPLQLLEKDGKDLNILGDLTNAMKPEPGVTLPPIRQDLQTANQIKGQHSSKIKLSIGVDILGNILKALSGKSLNASVGFERAKSISFQFDDVLLDRIDMILLDQFLTRSDINPNTKAIEKKMIDDQIGVITATLRSKKYLVTAHDESGLETKIDIPAIQQMLAGSLSVNSTKTGDTQIAYEGKKPVTFAVQAAQLFFDDHGNFTIFTPIPAGSAGVRSLGSLAAASTPTLFAVDGAFGRIEPAKSSAAGT